MKVKIKFSSGDRKGFGFTITELLVVISIMGIFTTMFLVNFAGLRGPRNLRIAQNEMVTNLRKIQSYTLSSRDVNLNDAARYYLINLVKGSRDYQIYAIGINKTTGVETYYDGSTAAKPVVESFTLPTGITVDDFILVNASNTTINPNPQCAQVGFSLPFSKNYIEYNTSSTTGCNFQSITANLATLYSKSNHILTVILKDSASNTTRSIKINGITGAIEGL